VPPPVACAREAHYLWPDQESPHSSYPHPLRVCSGAEKGIPILVHLSSSCSLQQWHLASPAGPDFPPMFLRLWCSAPWCLAHHFSCCFPTTKPKPLLRTDLWSLSLRTPLLSISGCGVLGGGTDGLCGSLSALSSSIQLLHFSLRL